MEGTIIDITEQKTAREQMERQGGEPTVGTAAEMLRVINEDYARMGTAIKIAKLKVE